MKKKIVLASLTLITVSAFAADKFQPQMGGFTDHQCEAHLRFQDRQDIDFSDVPNMQPLTNPYDYQTHGAKAKRPTEAKQMGDYSAQSDGQFR